MTFLAPGFLIAAAAAAAAVAALHFLSTREPKLELLPTARFLPDMPVRATSTTLRPSDIWLLVLRVLLILLVGAALARPVPAQSREPIARIVAVDISRAVGDASELRDSASTYLPAAAAIAFDAAAVELSAATIAHVMAALDARDAPRRGSLSAAFVAARRVAARIRDRADSLELVVISPFAAEEYDAATERVRSLWPGRVTTVAVGAAVAEAPRGPARVEWADSTATSLWSKRTVPDTVTAVRAGDAVLIHPFVRRWRLDDTAAVGMSRIYARWGDGEPAAVERRPDASGVCVRSIGFALPDEGDAILRPEFQRFVAGLAAPCGEPRDLAPLPGHVMAMLGGDGALAATAAIDRRVRHATPLTPWLLIAAALLALSELFVRRRRSRARSAPAAVGTTSEREPEGRAA